MIELQKQIARFQALATRTGRSKSSSYYVEFYFSPHFDTDDKVMINVGGYDVGSWSRHQTFESSGKTLLKDFTRIVDEADEETKNDFYCNVCQDYTSRDEDGNCTGWTCSDKRIYNDDGDGSNLRVGNGNGSDRKWT